MFSEDRETQRLYSVHVKEVLLSPCWICHWPIYNLTWIIIKKKVRESLAIIGQILQT